MSGGGESGPEIVDLSQLSIPQLDKLQKSLEEELEFFTDSLQQLKSIQQKFIDCQESIARLTAESRNKEILVPLTSSMYVPGTLADVETVLVDIGTGYFVEMTTEKAKLYFARKTEYVTKQIETVQSVAQEKARNRAIVNDVLQSKLQAHIQAMSQQQKGATGQ